MSVQEDLAWLRAVHNVLWSEEARRSGKSQRLSEEDTTRVFGLILRWSLPVTMCNTRYGFGVGLEIWEPELPALYPGVAQKQERLLVFSQENLPLSEAKKMSDRTLFDDGWRVFSPLVVREENRILSKRCGMPEPKDISHYVY